MSAPSEDVSRFHSRFNRILAAVAWLFCAGGTAALAFSLVLSPGDVRGSEYAPLVALVAFLVWAGLWRPAVLVSDSGVTLINVLSTVRVPWAALIQVDTRFALTLVTPNGRYTATAAPAPGRLTTALSKRDMRGIQASVSQDGRVRPGDLPNTDSGAAAYLVRARWEKLIEQERIEIGSADVTPVDRDWHWVAMAIIGVLLVATIVSLANG